MIEPAIQASSVFHYRNKLEYSFGAETATDSPKLGFHARGRWDIYLLDLTAVTDEPDLAAEAEVTAGRGRPRGHLRVNTGTAGDQGEPAVTALSPKQKPPYDGAGAPPVGPVAAE